MKYRVVFFDRETDEFGQTEDLLEKEDAEDIAKNNRMLYPEKVWSVWEEEEGEKFVKDFSNIA